MGSARNSISSDSSVNLYIRKFAPTWIKINSYNSEWNTAIWFGGIMNCAFRWAFCKTQKTDSVKMAPILKTPEISMKFDLKSQILSKIQRMDLNSIILDAKFAREVILHDNWRWSRARMSLWATAGCKWVGRRWVPAPQRRGGRRLWRHLALARIGHPSYLE